MKGGTMKGFYYLNHGKRLLFQKDRPRGAIREWEFDEETSAISVVWRIAIEALGLGARRPEVLGLLSKWKLSERTGIEFARRCGVAIEYSDGEYIASVANGKTKVLKFGSGRTVVDALADLATPGLYVSAQKGLRAATK
jgi:hypothetical protein